jgi:beta-phosphoglucomutase-like phosphatase (HAD superfamily)
MVIRAVVFDLDGLMFDTEALFYRVTSETLEALGKSFTPEMVQAMIGRRSVDVGHSLVLEDSPAGLAAARGAGAFAVGVPHEHSPAYALHDAELVVAHLDDPALIGLIDTAAQENNTA